MSSFLKLSSCSTSASRSYRALARGTGEQRSGGCHLLRMSPTPWHLGSRTASSCSEISPDYDQDPSLPISPSDSCQRREPGLYITGQRSCLCSPRQGACGKQGLLHTHQTENFLPKAKDPSPFQMGFPISLPPPSQGR